MKKDLARTIRSHSLRVIFLCFLFINVGYSQSKTEQYALIDAATARPRPGKNYPELPKLTEEMKEKIAKEIYSSEEIWSAFSMLDAANRRNTEWFEGVKELEEYKAIWSLHAALVHPHDDVQIHALRSIERLNDKRAVPFLLVYAEKMAVIEAGSENATLHGIIQQSIAKTLSKITGIEVELETGQDRQGLKKGIELWRKWLD